MAARRSRRTEAEPDTLTLEMALSEVRRDKRTPEGFEPVSLITNRGEVETRYYPAAASTRGAIFVGGAGGGFDTPVRGWLYPRICQRLQQDGIACLRIRYRYPSYLEECTLDVLAGIHFLESEQVQTFALTGHSFGGAVIIQAAAHSPAVRTCIPISTQTHGADPAAELGPRCSLLLLHGSADEVLPPSCSEYVYSVAREPKRLILKAGAHHGLDEWADELPDLLRDWILDRLPRAAARPAP